MEVILIAFWMATGNQFDVSGEVKAIDVKGFQQIGRAAGSRNGDGVNVTPEDTGQCVAGDTLQFDISG